MANQGWKEKLARFTIIAALSIASFSFYMMAEHAESVGRAVGWLLLSELLGLPAFCMAFQWHSEARDG